MDSREAHDRENFSAEEKVQRTLKKKGKKKVGK